MITLAYAAGLFDGEGCVQFTRCRSWIHPRILVVNTHRGVLEDLQHQFGGDINSLRHRRPRWKSSWMWRLNGGAAVRFLDRINPWLVIKARHAHTVFAWNAIRVGSGHRVTDDHREAFALLQERMKWLNRKGPNNDPDPVDAIAMRKAGKPKPRKASRRKG